MEETPESGKESSHSAHADGMNECMNECVHLHDVLKLIHRFPPGQECLNTWCILIQLAVLYLACYWEMIEFTMELYLRIV
jgi:hypothetical protein